MAEGARPGEAAWDAFYADWVAPLVHLATPPLVVLAVLLVATRLLTRLVVGTTAIGTGAHRRLPWQNRRFAYWLALCGQAVAAVELTVGVAVARGEHLHRAARVLTWIGACFAIAARARAARPRPELRPRRGRTGAGHRERRRGCARRSSSSRR